ncbi:hypothetical protein SAMN06297144_0288 [Sphingomonas guangdongensis]|uniref:5-bromo-4-chloroindolyl phosphate hydrolysis protein n=1 Tax=Sphingomonas guangdongensis TaxID=1141890 RepID=A0A285QFT3_9SPHN|nr:hypothetical protein [Sphingomonas guangdongensis]SOB78932.1 hypothetical protein SAMN06297144_0288 [Sphingomonas guangdongensis]
MTALITILLLVAFAVALILRPGRALGASVIAVVVTAVLIEGAGIGPRLSVVLAIALALLVLFGGGRRTAPAKASTPAQTDVQPVQHALARLTAQVGILTRSRVLALRRRVDQALLSDAAHDPTSDYTMLRIKLERRVPELIDVALADLPGAVGTRKRAITTELLDDVEGLLDRIEAADPSAQARADRRAALRNHLKGSGE